MQDRGYELQRISLRHDHNYQRFAPQDPHGRADAEAGIRQLVVGTRGRSHYEFSEPIANTEVYNDHAYGVLDLTLHPKRTQLCTGRYG